METMETIEWRECTPRIRCTKFGGCATKLHNTHLTCPDYSPVGGVVAFALQVARAAEAKVRAEYGATPEEVKALVVQSRGIKESHCFECRHRQCQ